MKIQVGELRRIVREVIRVVDAPPTVSCIACGGLGELAGSRETCSACGGTGRVPEASRRGSLGRGTVPHTA